MKIERVSERIYHVSRRFPDAILSLTAFVSVEGVLLVDTGDSEMAADLKSAVADWGFERPTYVISTHEHTDHVGCNAAFGPGPIVIAHSNTRTRLTSGDYIIEEIPEYALPVVEITRPTTLRFAGEEIRILPVAGAHTDNDVIVHFRHEGVGCLSDLYYGREMFPSVDAISGDVHQYPVRLREALDLLPRDTAIIPGHDERKSSWSDVQASHTMLFETIELVERAARKGLDLEGLQSAGVLDAWDHYGQAFTTTDQWIKYIWRGIQGEPATSTVIEPIYRVLQTGTGEDAVATFRALKKKSPTAYFFQAGPSMRIVYYLIEKSRIDDAVAYLRFMLEEFPDSKLNGYIFDAMGKCQMLLENLSEAEEWTRKALAYQWVPDEARARLAELEGRDLSA